MPRYKLDIGTIYISDRVQDVLQQISNCKFTTVTAPMGYGKTTAINWFLDQRREAGDKVLCLNVYSSNVPLFWRRFQAAFRGTEVEDALRRMEPPTSMAALALLKDVLESYFETCQEEQYLFIDDYHLMDDEDMTRLLLAIVDIPSDHHHLIVASRDTFLSRGEEMRLGRDLCKITVKDLRLNPAELTAYSRRCGIQLSDEELDVLNELSEGWFSAIYLNLQSYLEHRRLLTESHDIYEMLNSTLLTSLSPEEHEFLTKMCRAGEFTAEQAEFVTQLPNCREIANHLTHCNAFVRLQPDGVTYRFHHMLKECMERQFSMLPEEVQNSCYLRYGQWYEENSEYLLALYFYRKAGAHGRVLHLIGADNGIQIASLAPERVLSWINERTDEELMSEPRGLLVLMRRLFSLRQIPKMMQLKELLLKVAEREDIPEEERRNLRGECDLILSVLGYNDIEAMSVLHRSACSQMTRPAISIGTHNAYTFGSPSILMMFHRKAGELDREIESMNRSMPYYYQVTRRQGAGAEKVMEAEAMFLRGRYVDARIMLERAVLDAREKDQQYILLCCDLLAFRLNLCGEGEFDPKWCERKAEQLRSTYDSLQMTVLDGCLAYFYAVLGDVDSIPQWLAEGKLDAMNLLAPARPMYELIYSQILLAQGRYIEVAGRSEKLLELYERFPYVLCILHLHIQTAAALEALGKKQEAEAEMKKALDIALPDGIIAPFAENYRGVKQCFTACADKEFLKKVKEMAGRIDGTREKLLCDTREDLFRDLSESEFRVCQLAAEGKTNREIAEEMFLTEGSVKQYFNHIYAKLDLPGTAREKRRKMAAMLKKS